MLATVKSKRVTSRFSRNKLFYLAFVLVAGWMLFFRGKPKVLSDVSQVVGSYTLPKIVSSTSSRDADAGQKKLIRNNPPIVTEEQGDEADPDPKTQVVVAEKKKDGGDTPAKAIPVVIVEDEKKPVAKTENKTRDDLDRKAARYFQLDFPARIVETDPFDFGSQLTFVKANPSSTKYSASQCMGDNYQEDSWRVKSCQFLDLCYNVKTEEFLYYKREHDLGPESVSYGSQDQTWEASQYVNSTRFTPTIVNRSLSEAHYTTHLNELWIPYLAGVPSNVGHLIWDDFLPFFMLAHTYPYPRNYGSDEVSSNSIALRPLWVNRKINPPWASCDWIKQHEGPGHSLPAGYSDSCYKNYKRWLQTMIGKGGASGAFDTDHFLKEELKLGKMKSPLVCFSNAAVGLGALSEHCLSYHGWNPLPSIKIKRQMRPESVPCAQGRGSLFWAFRNHMLLMSHVSDPKPHSVTKLKILFSVDSSARAHADFTDLIEVAKRASDNSKETIGIESEVSTIRYADYTPQQQMEKTVDAAIIVTVAGGGAVTAQFLSRGTALILYHDAHSDSAHKGFVDWHFWENVGWLRPTFIDLRKIEKEDLFRKRLLHEMRLCAKLMPILKI